jgi:hypothetical protein
VLGWRDCVDDDQLSSATWTRQCEDTRWLIGIIDAVVIGVLPVWRFGSQQVSDLRDIGGTVAVSKEPVVTDAVLASGQNVDQEPADELICGQGHGGAAACAFNAVILDAEGYTARVETDQSAVGNGDPPSHGLLCKPLPVSGGCNAIGMPIRLSARRRVLWRRPPIRLCAAVAGKCQKHFDLQGLRDRRRIAVSRSYAAWPALPE